MNFRKHLATIDLGGAWQFAFAADWPAPAPASLAALGQAGVTRMGQALAGIIDVLNPDRIVIGSLYVRCRDLLDQTLLPVLRREALTSSLAACEIVPASLGERTGSFGAVCAGLAGIESTTRRTKP